MNSDAEDRPCACIFATGDHSRTPQCAKYAAILKLNG